MNMFQPHGVCLQWSPDLLIPTILGDLGTALAYTIIPLTLWLWARKQKGDPFKPYRNIVNLFAAFIILCGLSHVIDILVIYKPLYYMAAAERIVLAVVSLATAVGLLRLKGTKTRTYKVGDKTAVDLEFPTK